MRSRRNNVMADAGLFILRVVPGSFVAAHGAMKVFGAFQGPGPEGTRGMMTALRFDPPHFWGPLAGLSELVGGGLTAVGALSPTGPVVGMAPMLMATTTAHWGKPIWVTQGGAELPVTNMSVFAALAMLGPGRWSVDGLLGIRLPRWMVATTVAGVVAGTAVALATRRPAEEPPAPVEQPEPEAVASTEEREVELRGGGSTPSRQRVESQPGT